MSRNEAHRLASDIADAIRDVPAIRRDGFAIRVCAPAGEEHGIVLTSGAAMSAFKSREAWHEKREKEARRHARQERQRASRDEEARALAQLAANLGLTP